MKFDDILHELGDFGPYQRRLYLIVCLFVVPSSWGALIQVFAMSYSDHWCQIPGWNDSVCEEYGVYGEGCDIELKKLINIPFQYAGNVTGGTFQKCARYNISDFSGISVVINGSAGTGYTLTTDPDDRDSSEVIPCDAGWEYDKSQFTRTLVQEVDLVCDNANKIQFPQSFYYGGFLVGSLLFGILGDRFGRQRMLFMTIAGQIVVGYILAFVGSYWAFAVTRFFQGIFVISTYILAFVLGTEFVGISKRNISGIFINIPYACGYMFLAGLAYFIRDWRTLQIVLTTPLFLLFAFVIVLPESPRWLLGKGDVEKANKIIKRAAKINKVHITENLFEDGNAGKMVNLGAPKTSQSRPNFTDLFRHPNTRKRTFVLMYIWSACAIVYHGFNLSTSSLNINVYVSFFVSAAVEIPAYTIVIFIIQRPWFGRKRSTVIALMLGGVACLLTMCIPPGPFRAAVAFVGKFGISGAFALVYLYTTELYPTLIRAVGVGTCSMASRLASIIAPLILLTHDYWASAPLVIFGGTTIIAGFLALLLPETRGRKLPETVEDGENLERLQNETANVLGLSKDGGQASNGTKHAEGDECKI